MPGRVCLSRSPAALPRDSQSILGWVMVLSLARCREPIAACATRTPRRDTRRWPCRGEWRRACSCTRRSGVSGCSPLGGSAGAHGRCRIDPTRSRLLLPLAPGIRERRHARGTPGATSLGQLPEYLAGDLEPALLEGHAEAPLEAFLDAHQGVVDGVPGGPCRGWARLRVLAHPLERRWARDGRKGCFC